MPKRASPEYYAALAIAERHMSRAATSGRAAAIHAEMLMRCEAMALDPDLELPPLRCIY